MTIAALPLIGATGDFRPPRTIAAPAALYIKKANLDDSTGNAIPTAALNNQPNSPNDAIAFAAEATGTEAGIMNLLSAFHTGGAWDNDLPNENLACVGLTSGGIRIRTEQDKVPHESDQLRGIHNTDVSMNRWSLDTTLDEMTLGNLALAWGRSVACIGSSSFMLIKAADQELHSVMLLTKAPQTDAAYSTGTYLRALRVIQLFKAKVYSNGDITLSRTDRQGIPIMVEGYCDGNENWGTVWDVFNPVGQRIAAPEYNTAPDFAV